MEKSKKGMETNSHILREGKIKHGLIWFSANFLYFKCLVC